MRTGWGNRFWGAIAVLELLYPEADDAKWLFPEEKATLNNGENG
jgi:hypothetical protein